MKRATLAAALLLAGCGQKGALYLPDATPQAVPARPAAGAPAPAQPATTAPDDEKKKPASTPQR